MADLSHLTDDQLVKLLEAQTQEPTSLEGMSDKELMALAQEPPPEAPQADLSWSDVPGEMVRNFPESAAQFGSDIVQPILHPVDTLGNIMNIQQGVAQKYPWAAPLMGPVGLYGLLNDEDKTKYPEAVGEYMGERYGGAENIKRTLAKDPVGAAGDLSMLLMGGGTAGARLPGIAGKVSKAAQTAGKWVDPVHASARGAKLAGDVVGKTVAPAIVGTMSGTGMAPVQEAAKAGLEGGKAGEAFRSNLRGGAVEMEGILEDAKLGLQKMRQQRSAAYKAGMADVANDATVLDFNDIAKAFDEAVADNTFKGVPKSEGAAKALKEIKAELEAWGARDPVEFHTPEGIDALKQRIGDLADWKSKGDKENRAVEAMYNRLKGVIENQAPGYADTMRDYAEASEQMKNIEKELSVGNNAAAGTAMRKLTSSMRNNVNTNYGNRTAAVEALEGASGKPIIPGLAGQALNSWAPRGLQSLGTHAALTGVAGAALTPWALGTLPLQSPRVVGEIAYKTGQAAKGGRLAADLMKKTGATRYAPRMSAVQLGRLQRLLAEQE